MGWRRKVGMTYEQVRAARDLHAFRQRASLAAVRGERLDANGVVPCSGLVHHPARSIGAAVVDEDQLIPVAALVEKGLDLLDGAGQPLLLVVAGDDDAQVHAFGGHGATS